MKKFGSFLLAFILLLNFSVVAYASSNETETAKEETSIQWSEAEIQRPKARWTNISVVTLAVEPSGTNVTIGYDVQGYFKDNTVRVTASLQKFVNGQWITVKSQTKSSKFYCSSSFSGTMAKGTTARLHLNITVYDKYGNAIENFTTTSKTKTV